MILIKNNNFGGRKYPFKLFSLLFNSRGFAKKNVRVEKRATLPPRYESHVELSKSKIYTPESVNPKDLPHIFFHSFKHNVLDELLLARYIERARILAPQLSIKGFALILHTISKFLTHEFQHLNEEDNIEYELIDLTHKEGRDDDVKLMQNVHNIFKSMVEFIVTISYHLPSRLRYSQSKDLGMISLSVTKLNSLILLNYNSQLIKPDYHIAVEKILKRIANEAPSKLPFFGISELAALALSLSQSNILSLPWSRLTLYDLSVEMIDKLEILLVDQQYTIHILNDILSFICSMDRANVDNKGFWVYISQFLTNPNILSLISPNNAVVLANSISKRCDSEKLLESAINNIDSIDPVNIPRVVSLGLFISSRTKSELYNKFIKHLNPDLVDRLNCIQLTQVINSINSSDFNNNILFNDVKNAVYNKINQLVSNGKMTVKGAISILSNLIYKEEFKPLPDSLIKFIHTNLDPTNQKSINAILKFENTSKNNPSHFIINDLVEVIKQKV